MSVFDLPQALSSINGSANKYNVDQLYPVSGNISNSYVGSGSASGITKFQWSDSNLWWSPVLSYFQLQVTFLKGGNTTPVATDYVAYADNCVSTFWTNIQSQVGSKNLDLIDNVAVMDTALSYSNQTQNFLKTWASMSHIGEPFSTRLRNTTTNGTAGASMEFSFRPPLSLFQCKCLPPGVQFTIQFNWAASAIGAFESLYQDISIGTGAQQFQVRIDSFSFFKASLNPSPLAMLPQSGVIDLCPTVAQQYFSNNTNSLKQNITIPATTNRLLVVVQDINTQTNTTTAQVYNNCTPGAGLTGYNPITSFAAAYSNNSSTNTIPFSIPLQNLYITLPELGVQLPSPIYNFGSPGKIGDWVRAYTDWCAITQGLSDETKSIGSVPFGSFDISQPITQVIITATSPNADACAAGDPSNPQQATLYANGTTFTTGGSGAANYTLAPPPFGSNSNVVYVASGSTSAAGPVNAFSQTNRYGWLGRCPGPIFAFPVVRPENKTVSTGTLNLTFAGSPASVVVTVLSTYSMAIQLTHLGNGLYEYNLVEGI